MVDGRTRVPAHVRPLGAKEELTSEKNGARSYLGNNRDYLLRGDHYGICRLSVPGMVGGIGRDSEKSHQGLGDRVGW